MLNRYGYVLDSNETIYCTSEERRDKKVMSKKIKSHVIALIDPDFTYWIKDGTQKDDEPTYLK